MGGRPEIYNKLIRFRDRGVPLTQIQVLTKICALLGQTIPSDKIYGIKTKTGKKMLPADDIVDKEHYIHHLVKGVYKPAGSNFAQCIVLNPKSRWDLEIDRRHPTLKINYDFKNATKYKTQIRQLKLCYDNGIPMGILFNVGQNRYKVLGLGKITSSSGTLFIFESYGLLDKVSTELKKSALEDYDRVYYGPDIEKLPPISSVELVRNTKSFSRPGKYYEGISSHVSISHLLGHCEKGAWVIPNFQRFFDWDKNKVKKFLNSIFYGYHVGSLLLWTFPKELELGIKPVKGVDTPEAALAKCQVILDGQQRVTSLYYATKSPEFSLSGDKTQSFFYIDFNEFFCENKKEDVIKVFSKELEQRDCFQKLLFPLNRLDDHVQWVIDLKEFLVKSDPAMISRIDSMCNEINKKLDFVRNKFHVSYITLEDMPFDDVIDVFERINTTGKQLDSFDLLIAKISGYGINLKEWWISACKKYPTISKYFDEPEGGTKGLTIFQSMALCFTKSHSCKHDDILNVYKNTADSKEDFQAKWEAMLEWVHGTISRLELTSSNGFGVISKKWIPSESMISIMASLTWLIENRYQDKKKLCYERLEYWYWISVFSNAYASSSDSRKTSDYKLMKEWFDTDKIPQRFADFRQNFDSQLRLSYTDSNQNSILRGILSLLALAGAKDWDTNAAVLNQAIFANSKVNVDHIFPKSKYSNQPYNESILNKTWLHETTNKKLKRAKNPSTFINETVNKNFSNYDDFKKTLATHFINENALQALLDDDHAGFVGEREGIILQEIAHRIGSTKTEFKSSIMLDNIDDAFSDDVLGAS